MDGSTQNNDFDLTGSQVSLPATRSADAGASSAATNTSPPLTSASWDLATVPADGAPRVRRAALPQPFGKYELLHELGHGGMGVVYQARDTELDRVVALKRLRGGVLAHAQEVERFALEARAAAKFDHPNIVALLEVGEFNGEHYFTMPFLAGGSLAKHLDRFNKDPQAAVAVVEKVARAVDYLHDKNILHRDLKPANVLLDDQGEPKVADFGLAKFLDASIELTPAGQMLGTYPYMSPEQITGQTDKIGKHSDVWALGVMLFELLTGKRPFRGNDFQTLVREIPSTNPPRPRSLSPKLDASLESILLKCLEKEPGWRYESAHALVADLAKWRSGVPVYPERHVFARLSKNLRKRSVAAVAAVALLSIVLGAAAVAVFRSPQSESERERAAALRAVESDLSQGKPVELIGKQGPPRWEEWAIGKPHSQWSLGADGVFTAESWETGLLMLTRDPQNNRYVFRAQVQHRKGSGYAEVGIFFALNSYAAPEGTVYSFLTLGFDDATHRDEPPDRVVALDPKLREQRGMGNAVKLESRIRVESGADSRESRSFSLCRYFRIQPAGFTKPKWRTLELHVEPDEVRGSFDGQLVGAMRWSDIELRVRKEQAIVRKGAGRQLPELTIEPSFHPRQPLGLYLCDGTALFRNVEIEPMNDNNP